MLQHSLRLPILAVICFCVSPAVTLAGGLIRRIPEVGEFATFAFRDIPVPGYPGHLAGEGELVVKCVGSAEIDGRRHLWLELDFTRRTFFREAEPSTRNHITKLLVAEDTLLSHDCEIAKGWVRFDGDETPVEINSGLASELASESYYMVVREDVRMILLGIEDEEAIEAPREVTIGEEDRSLNTAFAGKSSSVMYETLTRSTLIVRKQVDRGSIWWLEDDLAFGVAAWESTVSVTEVIEGVQQRPPRTKAWTYHFDIVESGSGAVSSLPDHD